MADFSIDQLDAVQAGLATADIIKKAANAARNSACQFYHDYPGIITTGPAGLTFALWDGLCANSNSGLPPAPQPKFTGGQCPTYYIVHVTWDVTDTQGQFSQHRDESPTIEGPIKDISVTNDPGQSVGLDILHLNSFAGQYVHYQDKQGFNPRYVAQNLVIISVTRQDGQPDNCGSIPPTYPPPVNPPPPIPGTTNTYNLGPLNFTYNDGTTINFSPTLTLDGGGGLPAINFGGIGITIGGGGITINGGGGSGPGGSTPGGDIGGILAGIAAGLGGIATGIGGLGGGLSDIKNTTDNINKNTLPPPPPGGPGTKPPVTKPPADKKVDGLAKLISVQIILTKLPPQGVIVLGTPPANNTMYTGWFNWRQAGHDLAKQQVTYADNIFLAPKGVDGYSYTLTHGAEGYAVENTGSDS